MAPSRTDRTPASSTALLSGLFLSATLFLAVLSPDAGASTLANDRLFSGGGDPEGGSTLYCAATSTEGAATATCDDTVVCVAVSVYGDAVAECGHAYVCQAHGGISSAQRCGAP